MIPILYETSETSFTSNGLGRLRDCISCIVTEERNGIYECDFEYPVDGHNYDNIRVGRIIGVTHDDTDDIQPFDIVSYTRPIDGIVTFHCVHISYRQSYLTATGSSINSLADAFTLLSTAEPSNPFTYSTDKTSTGFMSTADGIPKTVRSLLGGVEGSILDTYGGEYEWDRFNVILHSARGVERSFSIRYGVNMLDYNEEYDTSGAYSSCIPYWTNGTVSIIGDRVDSDYSTITGRGECVPLDLSQKFDSEPTQAQVESAGLSYMNSNETYLPQQNIHVEFIRLQDMPEYEGFANLMRCNLCDTVKVIFPYYDTSKAFKIVKVEWNVLENKYESMELGDLATTLSEALGISGNSSESETISKTTIDSFSSGWGAYSGYTPTLRRSGKTVHFTGAFTNSSSETLNATDVTICTIPEGYRPPSPIAVVCQGSSTYIWLLRILTDGTVQASRYRISTSYGTAAASSWFPFNVTWITD